MANFLMARLWWRVTVAYRIVLLILGAANLWTLVDAAGRRLPALPGW